MSEKPTYTIDDIEWRESELEEAVAFLDAVNPRGYTAGKIKAAAFDAWKEGEFEPTFIGTAGWYVTIVRKRYESDKPFIALVSIMSFSALRALKEAETAVSSDDEHIAAMGCFGWSEA